MNVYNIDIQKLNFVNIIKTVLFLLKASSFYKGISNIADLIKLSSFFIIVLLAFLKKLFCSKLVQYIKEYVHFLMIRSNTLAFFIKKPIS